RVFQLTMTMERSLPTVLARPSPGRGGRGRRRRRPRGLASVPAAGGAQDVLLALGQAGEPLARDLLQDAVHLGRLRPRRDGALALEHAQPRARPPAAPGGVQTAPL